MPNVDEQKLLDMKEDIEKAKSKISELKGTKKHLMKELQEQWKCSTLKDAHKKVSKLEEEIEKLIKQIDEGIAELEEKYEVG